jgi:hypothetical protein
MKILDEEFFTFLDMCGKLFDEYRSDRNIPLYVKKDILDFSTAALRLYISAMRFRISEPEGEL